MAQGAVKKTAKPAFGKPKHSQRDKSKLSGITKKKKAKSSADKFTKKLSAGLITQTEQMLGEKAGHLELIGKGKKHGKTGVAQKPKGGSRKYG
jgi:hypothetical protein